MMMGLLVWKTPREGKRETAVALSEKHILRLRLLTAEVARGERTPEIVWRRRLVRAAKAMGKRGVTRIIPPEGFSQALPWEKYGLRVVSTLPLRRRMAADWAWAALSGQGIPPAGARVAVSAGQMTGELVRTVTEASLRHRYVLLDVPHGGEELCRQLRREYGVSLLLSPGREQLEGAEALVLFDDRTDLRRKNPVVLSLYDENAPMMPMALSPALEEQIPPGTDCGRLMAALMETGALRPGQMAFKTGSP